MIFILTIFSIMYSVRVLREYPGDMLRSYPSVSSRRGSLSGSPPRRPSDEQTSLMPRRGSMDSPSAPLAISAAINLGMVRTTRSDASSGHTDPDMAVQSCELLTQRMRSQLKGELGDESEWLLKAVGTWSLNRANSPDGITGMNSSKLSMHSLVLWRLPDLITLCSQRVLHEGSIKGSLIGNPGAASASVSISTCESVPAPLKLDSQISLELYLLLDRHYNMLTSLQTLLGSSSDPSLGADVLDRACKAEWPNNISLRDSSFLSSVLSFLGPIVSDCGLSKGMLGSGKYGAFTVLLPIRCLQINRSQTRLVQCTNMAEVHCDIIPFEISFINFMVFDVCPRFSLHLFLQYCLSQRAFGSACTLFRRIGGSPEMLLRRLWGVVEVLNVDGLNSITPKSSLVAMRNLSDYLFYVQCSVDLLAS